MPMNRYMHDTRRDGFFYDEAQAVAVRQLQQIKDELVERYEAAKQARKNPLLRLKAAPSVPGLYMWGGVGRGKTYLMDVFYDALPFRRKVRMHFHRFMVRVHEELNDLKGQKNPLDIVAERLHKEAVVICFDEFFVSNITDAMLLRGLFEKLFEKGVTLVATSNITPDRLYENGLQRERFLPAIALVKQNCAVLNVDSGMDYRLRVLTQAPVYFSPLGPAAEQALSKSFQELTAGVNDEGGMISVNHREIPVIAKASDVLWVSFTELCETTRAPTDYIEIAKQFHTVYLSGVPVLDAQSDNAARRFISLVDEFYDRQVKLIISAEAVVDSIYEGGRLSFEIGRTRSRLLEMQSQEYLALPHMPN